jgi:hypothetical protein
MIDNDFETCDFHIEMYFNSILNDIASFLLLYYHSTSFQAIHHYMIDTSRLTNRSTVCAIRQTWTSGQ